MGRLGARQERVESFGAQFTCTTCGKDVGTQTEGERSPGIWRGGAMVFHCPDISFSAGNRCSGEPHHFTSLHPNCWSCGAKLGCRICSGISSQLVCTNRHDGTGPVWATLEALLEHGPLARQTIEQYPPHWARKYREKYADDDSTYAARGVNGLQGLIHEVLEASAMEAPDDRIAAEGVSQ